MRAFRSPSPADSTSCGCCGDRTRAEHTQLDRAVRLVITRESSKTTRLEDAERRGPTTERAAPRCA
eukprot:1281122-Pleurochrysis_carterae.AAC.1